MFCISKHKGVYTTFTDMVSNYGKLLKQNGSQRKPLYLVGLLGGNISKHITIYSIVKKFESPFVSLHFQSQTFWRSFEVFLWTFAAFSLILSSVIVKLYFFVKTLKTDIQIIQVFFILKRHLTQGSFKLWSFSYLLFINGSSEKVSLEE